MFLFWYIWLLNISGLRYTLYILHCPYCIFSAVSGEDPSGWHGLIQGTDEEQFSFLFFFPSPELHANSIHVVNTIIIDLSSQLDLLIHISLHDATGVRWQGLTLARVLYGVHDSNLSEG